GTRDEIRAPRGRTAKRCLGDEHRRWATQFLALRVRRGTCVPPPRRGGADRRQLAGERAAKGARTWAGKAPPRNLRSSDGCWASELRHIALSMAARASCG